MVSPPDPHPYGSKHRSNSCLVILLSVNYMVYFCVWWPAFFGLLGFPDFGAQRISRTYFGLFRLEP